MRAQVEVTAECPACRTRGTWIELYDPAVPASALGVPAAARCRLCDAASEGRVQPGNAAISKARAAPGACPCCRQPLSDAEVLAHACARCGAKAAAEFVRPGVTLGDPAVLADRLRALMQEEGDDDPEAFVRRCFATADIPALAARYAAGETVESTLGSADFLGTAIVRSPPERKVTSDRPGRRALADDRRAMLLALVSVLMADGQRDPREVPLLEEFLRREGLAPLAPDELRVYRPAEIAGRVPLDRREGLVSLMAQLAYADGVADPSEERVVRAFADAWDLPAETVDAAFEKFRASPRSRRRRLLDRLRTFFLTGS